jgi:glutathione S-transferase
MSITLWGRPSSSNVQKVRWALGELELDYEYIPLGGTFGGLDSPDYLAMNPNGLVPTLRDRDLILWESHAILRYLAAEYGSGLIYPVEPRSRAIVDQWTDWTATTFGPAWIALFWHVVRTPVDQHDAAAIAHALATTVKYFGMMEDRLGVAKYLGGNDFSYADMAAGIAMHRWSTMNIERPKLPNVEAWHRRLEDRAAYDEAVAVSYEDLRGRLAF